LPATPIAWTIETHEKHFLSLGVGVEVSDSNRFCCAYLKCRLPEVFGIGGTQNTQLCLEIENGLCCSFGWILNQCHLFDDQASNAIRSTASEIAATAFMISSVVENRPKPTRSV
jgi:hypothetical protein